MFVARELSGMGVGSRLMRALIDRASALPTLQQLDLTVTLGNDGAQGLYARFGFVSISVTARAIQVAVDRRCASSRGQGIGERSRIRA